MKDDGLYMGINIPEVERQKASVIGARVTRQQSPFPGNGISMPETKVQKCPHQLVQSLAKQLDAQVAIASDAHGTAVSVTHATFKSKPLKAA